MESFEIYTDGSNKGRWGSWSYIILKNGVVISEASGRSYQSDCNRMEFQAVIEALGSLSYSSKVIINTDSLVLIESVKLLTEWASNYWLKKNGRPIPNVDLFISLHKLLLKHTVTFKWIRAHSGNIYNERCDMLCVEARSKL